MSENIKVAVRLRPLNNRENDLGDFRVESKTNTLTVQSRYAFSFDSVFSSSSRQEEVFNSIGKDAVEWVCQGYNSTIFAYGATSSGKSYTMFGSEQEKGIIPRACDLLFALIEGKEEVLEATLKCSFVEIYREHIRDLLRKSDISLRLREGTRGVYIQNLLEKIVYSSEEILSTIAEGALQRTTASTALNAQSSRSHAVLTLVLTQKLNDGTEIVSKLNLVDLAGSENVGRSEVSGTNLAEAQTINKSLSCLGNVIYALTEKGREHVPYRDSKLTFLLQDSLGGNSRTILIATLSPSQSCYSETLNTLKFARRVKEIKNDPKVNKVASMSNLQLVIDEQKKKIDQLEEALTLVKNRVVDDGQVAVLSTELEKHKQQNKALNDQLLRQEQQNDILRQQIYVVSKQCSLEQVRNKALQHELDQYRIWRDSLQQANPEALELLVRNMRVQPHSQSLELNPADWHTLQDQFDLPSPI